ncbi:Uncharacterised protein [Segatella copri]|nr:Uncharacterised protein [Segatella copri]
MLIQQLDDVITKLRHKRSTNLTLSQRESYFFKSLHSLTFCKPCQSTPIDRRPFIIRTLFCQVCKICTFAKGLINRIDSSFHHLLFVVKCFLSQSQEDMCNMNTASIGHQLA